MTLAELKNLITSGIAPSSFLIFVCTENKFLARQYLNEISKLATGGLHKIASVYEPIQSSAAILASSDDAIHVLSVDTFDERAEDYNQFEKTIVVCDRVDKSISSAVEPFVIKFPKLEEWQILDYAKSLCPSIEEGDLLWLIRATKNDIERVCNELDKVLLFSADEQKAIFAAIRFDQQSDLLQTDWFTLSNALVDGNPQQLFSALKLGCTKDIDPVALANSTLTALKNILLITQIRGISAEDLGISVKYFNKVRYSYASLNTAAVKRKIKFLAEFDVALKTSKLDLQQCDMLTYLIANLMYKITL